MTELTLLGICLFAGFAFRYWKILPKEAPQVFNGFIFYISLPSLIIRQFHEIQFSFDSIYPALMAWIVFVSSLLVFKVLGRVFSLDPKTEGTLVIVSGLGNTSFVGFPMIEVLFGKDGLKTALLTDQLGSFLVLATLGIMTASYYSAMSLRNHSSIPEKVSLAHSIRSILKKIFSFPPMYSLLLAFVLRPVVFPEFVQSILVKLGGTLGPIALVSVGYQLKIDLKLMRKLWIEITAGLLFKLILAPLFLTLIYLYFLGVRGSAIHVTLIEAAMAPMITAAVLASEYELNSDLANILVGIGIPLSLFTVPAWFYLLQKSVG